MKRINEDEPGRSGPDGERQDDPAAAQAGPGIRLYRKQMKPLRRRLLFCHVNVNGALVKIAEAMDKMGSERNKLRPRKQTSDKGAWNS